MTINQFKKALQNNERVYGTLITSPSPKWLQYVTKIGLDFVFIDMEHIPLDRSMVSWMCQAYAHAGVVPIVRIPYPDPYEACMALDGGACGIVAPYVETTKQVKVLRGAIKYRPLKGERLAHVLSGEEILSEKEKNYLKAFSQDALMILNIESRIAMDNIDMLLAEPDIDAVFIGPHDLSISLGVPEEYESEAWNEACLQIIRKCREKGIAVANHFSDNIQKQLLWAREGMNMILWNSDIVRMSQALHHDFAYMREELGDGDSTTLVRMDI